VPAKTKEHMHKNKAPLNGKPKEKQQMGEKI